MQYDKEWYDSLAKPDFQPPPQVFKPVWMILYFLMFVSLFIVLLEGIKLKVILAFLLFLSQLIINLYWPRVFFIEHNLRKAFLTSALLTFFVFFTMVLFFKVSTLAGVLLLPYFLWCCFATLLSFEILELNEW